MNLTISLDDILCSVCKHHNIVQLLCTIWKLSKTDTSRNGALSKLFSLFTVFTTQPKSTAVILGSDLVLNCSALLLDRAGNPLTSSTSQSIVLNPIAYQWSLNGNATAAKTSIFANHSLYVPRLTSSDLGNYLCVVTWYANGGDVIQAESNVAVVVETCEFFCIDFVYSLNTSFRWHRNLFKTPIDKRTAFIATVIVSAVITPLTLV